MPGETWLGATLAFLGMWAVMMAAMMSPLLLPMLRRYRRALGGTPPACRAALTTLVGAGYFCVWIGLGAAVFPLGVVLAALTIGCAALARGVPFATAGIVLAAGLLQLSRWKTHQLARCRALETLGDPSREPGAAWRHGLKLGIQCCYCCAGFTAILLVVGLMNLPAMALMTLASALERLAPAGVRIARAIGVAIVAVGVMMAAHASGL
jgi:predicted metal-binding membrane protein